MLRREMKLGEVLCQKGYLNDTQLAVALADQQITGDKLGRILVRLGFISESILMETLEIMLGVPYIRLERYVIENTAVQLVPSSLAQRHKVLPLSRRENKLILAMADPLDYMAIEDVTLATSLEVVPVLAGEQELDWAIRKYSTVFLDSQMGSIIREFEGCSDYRAVNNSESTGPEPGDGAPVVRMVDSLFDQAVLAGASDIHIEPQEDRVRVRLRIDGELKDILSLPSDAGPAVASRIKIMSGIDIAEKRLPQDGRTRAVINGRVISFRVSTFPTIYGEKLVLSAVESVLNSHGEVLAYYRENRIWLDEKTMYEEITWWLTERALIRFTATEESISSTTYLRDWFERIERTWLITNSFGPNIDLESVNIYTKQGHRIVLNVPEQPIKGQPKKFEELVSLLG